MSKSQLYTDEQLVDLLKSGHSGAFTEIYDRYWNKLTAVAYNYTRDKSQSKEIVQELFIGVWKRRKDVEIQNLNAYLSTAVKFAVFKHIERERRHREIENECRQAESTPDDELIEARFLQEYIYGLIEELPEKCRLVFNYSRIKGLSNAEVAKELGISEKTVEGHLTKGLKTLRLTLKDSGLLGIALGSSIYYWLK